MLTMTFTTYTTIQELSSLFKLINLSSSFQDYSETETDKVVVYITTLGVLRETFARCVKVSRKHPSRQKCQVWLYNISK